MDEQENKELKTNMEAPEEKEPEFSLEDIMKEFGEPASEEADSTPEAEPAEDMEATQVLEDLSEFGGIQEVEAVDPMEVTQVIETVESISRGEGAALDGEDEALSDTIRLDQIRPKDEALRDNRVRDASPVEEEEQLQEEKPAFEGDWEPEYEQPMGDYIPAPPVIVHPRSRLKELKKKLIAGPEKLYYEMMEQGVGKIQLAMLVCLMMVAVSAVLTVLYGAGVLSEDRLRFVGFFQFFAMLLCALVGVGQLVDGGADLIKGRFTLNTLLCLTFAVCCADGVFSLLEQRIPCCAAFGLEMTMSLWSVYHRRTTRMGQLDTMRKATRLDKISTCEDYLDGQKGFLRSEGQVEDFMDVCDQTPGPEKLLDRYALGAAIAGVVAGVGAGVLYGVSTGLWIAAVTLLAAAPATVFIAVTRPMAVLERRLHNLGTVICGWQGVKGLCGKAMFPLDHNDLFPSGTVRMNGVKFFGERKTDQVVEYAAAMIEADGGALEPLFEQLLESRNGQHYAVENFTIYNEGGIGGEVCDEPVLVGSLSFLKKMGVEIPEGLRVSSAVCISVDGELCGLFALHYEKTKDAASGMVTLTGYRGLKPVLVCPDFMLTGSFLSAIFGVRPKKLLLPDQEVRSELREKVAGDAPALAMSTQIGLAPFAYSVTGARALRTACTLGVVLHILGGVLGVGVVVTMTVLNALQYLTPLHMFLYQLVWIAPALLISEWTRSV